MSAEEFLKRATKTQVRRSKIDEKEDVEAPFVRYAKKKGCRAMKLLIFRRKGFPDRTVLCPGARVFFIEFKRPGKKPSPAQILVRRMLESLGFEYHVCDKPGQAEEILENFLAFL